MKYSVHYVHGVAKAHLNLGIMNPDFCKIHEPHKVTSLLILHICCTMLTDSPS